MPAVEIPGEEPATGDRVQGRASAGVTRWARELVAPVKIALVVGTTLCFVNGTFASGSVSRIALNYLVPFLVSSYSRITLLRKLERERGAGAVRDREGPAAG